MVGNRLMSVASIGVLTACIAIIGVASLLSLNVNSFVTFLGGKSEIVVYVKDIETDIAWQDMTEEERTGVDTRLAERVMAVENGINATPNINTVKYVSKQDALNEQMEQMGDYSYLLEDFAAQRDIYPASFRVTVKDLELIGQTAEDLTAIDGVDFCVTSQSLSNVLLNLRLGVNVASIGLVAVLVLVSLVVIANTIRLTVFARRKEINIMKFVGATNAFIRLPFLVEGMLVGLISAVLAFGIISGGYVALLNYLTSEGANVMGVLSFQLVAYNKIWYMLLGGFVLSGVVVGGLGSATSIRKHLKV